jgi:TonB family protein
MKIQNTVTAGFLALTILAACISNAVWARDGIERPVPVHTVAPKYPVEQLRAGVCGVVTLSFVIDTNGKVRNAKVLDATDESFARPALEAIVWWRFEPARRDGVAIAVPVAIPMVFSLSGDEDPSITKYVARVRSRLEPAVAPVRPERKTQVVTE